MRLRITGEGIDEVRELPEGETVLGRTDECALRFRVRSISRRHAKFTLKDGILSVEDLGSSNGIVIKGKRVKSAQLKPGDELTVGTLKVRVESDVQQDADEETSLIPAAASAASETDNRSLVPAEPDEEDEPTPFDPLMLPATQYAPQPQVVMREGRLFIRDPATGREMEVAPVAQGGPIAETGLRRSSRVRKAAIAAGLVVAAAIVLKLILAARQPSGQAPPPAPMTAQQYNDLLSKALTALENGDETTAKEKTLQSYRGRPNVPVARIVAEIIKTWPEAASGNLDKQRELVLRLRELRRSGADERIIQFANRHLEKLAGEAQYEADVAEAKVLHENGDHAQAWARLRGIPESSPTRVKFAQLFESCRNAYADFLRSNLERDSAAGRWAEAINSLDALIELGPPDKAALEARRLEFRQKQGISERIEEIEKALAAGEIEKAEMIAISLPEKERSLIAPRIEIEKKLLKARIAYNAGNVPLALSTLEGLEDPRAGRLREKMRKVFAAWESARESENNLDFEGAQAFWREISDAEDDRGNFFLKAALEAQRNAPRKREEAAARLQTAGDQARQEGDFARARSSYEKAAELGNEAAAGCLAALTKEGELDYNRALNQEKSDPKEAARLYRLALAKLPEGHRFRAMAQEALARLQQSGK